MPLCPVWDLDGFPGDDWLIAVQRNSWPLSRLIAGRLVATTPILLSWLLSQAPALLLLSLSLGTSSTKSTVLWRCRASWSYWAPRMLTERGFCCWKEVQDLGALRSHLGKRSRRHASFYKDILAIWKAVWGNAKKVLAAGSDQDCGSWRRGGEGGGHLWSRGKRAIFL